MEISTERHSKETMLAAKVRLSEHVVYRVFVKETVILNLRTGKYHGLNPTAGRMLDVLQQSAAVQEAIGKLGAEYDRPVGEMEIDVTDFCQLMLDRGLIELGHNESR